MAESPDDRVLIVHAEASPDTPVEVSRHEFESVWKERGWKLQPKSKKEGN